MKKRILPNGYQIASRYRFKRIVVNIMAIFVLFLSFLYMGPLFRAEFNAAEWLSEHFSQYDIHFVINLTIALLIFVLQITTHELIHGAVILAFGRKKPLFGLKVGFAYAAIPPQVFLSKVQFMICTLAPLVSVTIIGILACRFVTLTLVGPIYSFAIMNIAGSTADMAKSLWIYKQKRTAKFGFDGTNTIVIERKEVAK